MEHGVFRHGTKLSILEEENKGLLKEVRAKNERKKQRRKVLRCSGRVITLACVQKIRQEEEARNAAKAEAAARKEKAKEATKETDLDGAESLSRLNLNDDNESDSATSGPKRRRTRRPPTCSVCGTKGHTCRTCPNEDKYQ
jgi:hypothetical protein